MSVLAWILFVGGPADGTSREETREQAKAAQECPPDGRYTAAVDGARTFIPTEAP